ncbi:hypothetical protein BaRGS_00034041 [Batillaria attramentaria]|uniref:Uncharacterized protein n=1 Tax=Batillaria attramentaria TaxID=370345 RepID=A0ABD0JJ23_9CAEN
MSKWRENPHLICVLVTNVSQEFRPWTLTRSPFRKTLCELLTQGPSNTQFSRHVPPGRLRGGGGTIIDLTIPLFPSTSGLPTDQVVSSLWSDDPLPAKSCRGQG